MTYPEAPGTAFHFSATDVFVCFVLLSFRGAKADPAGSASFFWLSILFSTALAAGIFAAAFFAAVCLAFAFCCAAFCCAAFC
jgi:hypothetical protein